MKFNIILGLIFSMLLAFGYYTQEYLPSQNEKQEVFGIVEGENLKEIKAPFYQLSANGEDLFIKVNDQKLKVDTEISREFFKLLSTLSVVERLESKKVSEIGESSFFSYQKEPEQTRPCLEFLFEKEKSEICIGNKVKFDQSFYLKVTSHKKTKFYRAKIDQILKEVYNEKEYGRSEEHYRSFLGLVLSDQTLFFPRSLFSGLELKTMEVVTTLGRRFSINFENQSIEPVLFEQIKINQKKIKDFQKELRKFRFSKTHYPYSENQLKGFTSQVEFTLKNKQSFTTRVYSEYAGKRGYFVWIKDLPFLYEMKAENSIVFHPHLQDFYYKSPFHDKVPKNQVSIQKVKKAEVLKGYSKSKLFRFLATSTDWVSLLDKIDHKTYSTNQLLEVKVEEKIYKLFQNQEDLVLINDKTKIKYHYYRGYERLKELGIK
ncbi:MAG: hypothetical protein ACPGJV_05980 [Bacteriovoracaceae bacterium]